MDLYLTPRPEDETKLLPTFKVSRAFEKPLLFKNINDLPSPDKTKLLYHVNKLTSIYCLCIPLMVAPDIFAIAHKKEYPDFSYYYKIITRSRFIWGLTKLLRTFICHCPQCLALQTRGHNPYGSLQPIESPPVPFFILTLDFIFAHSVSVNGFNALMSITCKLSKRIILIKEMDT